MTYEIRNNVEQGISRLPSQFNTSPLLLEYLSTYLNGVDQLQISTDEILAGARIETAVGVQLENIGKLVGEDRLSRTDEDYRVAIKTRIILNASQGSSSDILLAAKALSSSTKVNFWEHYPASVVVAVDGENFNAIPASIVEGMDQAAAAGVSIEQVLIDTTSDGLIFSEIVFEEGTIQTGSGDDLITDEGDFVGYQIITSGTVVSENSLFVETVQANLVVDQTYGDILEVNSAPLIVNGEPYETGTVKFVLNGDDWNVAEDKPDLSGGSKFFEVLT